MWDLTLPGYKYLGPFNKLNKGEPTNESDRAALEHDKGYAKLLSEGKRAYTQFNDADEQFLKRVKTNDYGGWLGKQFFTLKKAAFQHGFIGHTDRETPQRLRRFSFPTLEPTDRVRKRLRGSEPLDNETRVRQATLDEQGNASFTNLQPSTNMSQSGDGGGSGNAAGLRETPVDNPYVIYRGPPDYTFASLPFVETRYAQLDNYLSRDHIYRLTSPYDCQQANAVVDSNVGAGQQNITPESADGTLQKARWFDYYAGLYNYYHVVSCQYNVFIENLSSEPIWVYMMFYNDDQPNTQASNDDMQLWNGCKYWYLDRRAIHIQSNGYMETAGEAVDDGVVQETSAATGDAVNFETGNIVSNNGKCKQVISGEYKSGQFRREIRLDANVENWTLTNTNPLLPEKMMIRIKPVNDGTTANSASNYGDDLKYKIVTKLNYLVEFKELPTTLRYPVQRQPLTVTIASDVTSAN